MSCGCKERKERWARYLERRRLVRLARVVRHLPGPTVAPAADAHGTDRAAADTGTAEPADPYQPDVSKAPNIHDLKVAGIASAPFRIRTPHSKDSVLKSNILDRDYYRDWETDRKSTRLNSSHSAKSRMPSSA